MTHLLCTNLIESDNENFFTLAEKKFSNGFISKYSKYKRWQDAKSTILGRLLLAYGLQHIYDVAMEDVKIGYSKDKKPFLEHSNIQFNISHSNEFIVCAFTTTGDIGVDVEQIKEVDVNDFKDQFSRSEFENILSSKNVQENFYDYWTQKEAVLKAFGTGLHIALDVITIIDNTSKIENRVFYLEEISLTDHYKCHVATEYLRQGSRAEVNHLSPVEIIHFLSANSFKTMG